MAALAAPSSSLLAAFLPLARSQLLSPRKPRLGLPSVLLPALLTPIPRLLDTLRDIPRVLDPLWDGLLRAVPKKKTSHMKKRHRQYASGKGLRDVTALNRCSACGRMKRAHVLCPYCVQSIRAWMGNGFASQEEVMAQKREQWKGYNEERRVMGLKPVMFPGDEGKEATGEEKNQV